MPAGNADTTTIKSKFEDMENYILQAQAELTQLIRDLCALPAPSGHEELRAEFCRKWFVENGCGEPFIDEALNVVCPWNVGPDNDLVVFMAHTDTVFPDREPLPFSQRDGLMFCPGVTDNTASLAVMMICARWMFAHAEPGNVGMLFVANSCEEGLGNLKGSRKIVETYKDRMRALIALDDPSLTAVTNRAVGSHRYRVCVHTEGGHSFAHFGNSNAIERLAALIQALYGMELPAEPGSKTTFNVGTISGGTSVNTIAQQAEMLYEYRSDSLKCLMEMERRFGQIIEDFRREGCRIEVEKIGARPCAAHVDPAAQAQLISWVSEAMQEALGAEPQFKSGSTDANAALAAGIPALCIGVCRGGKCHTREEWLDPSSLADGCRLLMRLLEKIRSWEVQAC